MKRHILPSVANGEAAVIAMTVAALLLVGCSKRDDSSKPDQRAPTATNLADAQPRTPNAFAEFGPPKKTFSPGEVGPPTNAVPDWARDEVAELKAKAEKGDAQAQYELGKMLWLTNDTEALKWFVKAAEQDHKDACFYAGQCFRTQSPTNDPSKGFEFDLRGARLGQVVCAFFAGRAYIFGYGTATNVAEGIRWVQKSADQGYAFAQSSLAYWYYEGKHVEKNLTNAIHYYQLRAEAGDERAQFLLGYIHATETKNYTEAAKWFRKLAEAGNPYAQYNLALQLNEGKGMPQDKAEAVAWYRKAAEAGNVEAQGDLSLMYREGEGVPRDYGEAIKWMRKAAEQGHFGAQNNLGVAYAGGEGIPRDYVEAYKWYNLATAGAADSEQRETARKNLDGIARRMTPDQIAEAQRRSSAFVARKEADATTKRRDIFDIVAELERPKATGTAFFITDDGYLLTSAHVVSQPEPKTAEGFLDARPVTRIEVTVAGKTHAAKLVKADKANDVAVLQVTGNFKALPFAPSRSVKLGDTICTIGFPNADIQGTEPKFTTGEINSLAGIQDDPRHFQISVPVQPGNSGGPLLDSSGNVIGLVSARLADIATLKITGSLPQNVNYALKSSFVTAFLETLPDVSPKLKSPRPVKARSLAEIADEAKPSVALVTIY